MPIKLNTASGGGVILTGANTASDKTITVPAVDGTMNMSGAANEVPAGSASAPAIYPTGDTNTGIFFPAADTIAFSEGGAEAMRLDSSGNVGIGTSSPTSRLHVHTAGSSYSIVQITNGDTGSTVNDGLHIGMDNNGTTAAFNIRDASGVLVFRTQDAERARIASNGNLLVATTSSPTQTGAIVANNELFVYNIPTTASGANCTISSGEGNRFYRSTSALKYKQDIRDIELIDIGKFRPVRYKSKCENDDQTKDHFGIIADEVAEEGFEELVTRGVDGEIEGFQYDRLTVVLLKTVQEQQQMIETLQAKVAALEAK
jgi:hypothetical protein